MSPTFSDHDLDAELVFDRLLTWDDLVRVQAVLLEHAPRWSRRLRWRRSARDHVPIDVSEPDALAAIVVAGAGERGETYWALIERHGPQPLERYVGSVELRGTGPELIAVISIDQKIVSPLGSRRVLRNGIRLQVRGAIVDGRASRVWIEDTFADLVAVLSPAWGSVRHPGEYWSKVMTDAPRVEAVGRDFGRWLPGVFWLNYFGAAYCDLVGAQVVLDLPGSRRVGAGVLIRTGDDPTAWNDPAQRAGEQQIRDRLGDELFFSKQDPDRVGRVPDWGQSGGEV